MWYSGGASEGLRSVGEEALPSSKSMCSILPIARLLRAGVLRAPALTLSWRRCRHSKRRRWKGAWWVHWLVSSRDGLNRSGLRRMAARNLRRNIIPDDMGIPSLATPGPIGGRPSEARPQLVREYNRSHYPVGHGLPSRPPDRTLLTLVRGRGVLRTSALRSSRKFPHCWVS